MGQRQSSEDTSTPQEAGQRKTDYYELLEVDRQATEDEIKKAYRRKALELHPDRNYGNVENATKLFAEIQSAYEVLSDPQERAWYDSHRDVLLRGEQGGQGAAEEFSYNIRMTTADEVLNFIMKFNSRMEFTDSPSGFYGGLRDFFKQLAREEEIACQWEDVDLAEYPEFGHKDDDYEGVVRPFYASWNGFATRKSYSWKDVYRLSEAPDRRVRRLMERENKRHREEAIQEYNDAVRSFIAFVRKRDPRYQENQKSEAERQKILRDASAAQKARSRAARQARMEEMDQAAIPDWAKSRPVDEYEGGFSSEEEAEEHQFDCVVCNKSFKSEAQYEAHEKSKKHIKLMKQLRKEMKDQDQDLNLEVPGERLEGAARNGDLLPHQEASAHRENVQSLGEGLGEKTRRYGEGAQVLEEDSDKRAEPVTNGDASSKLGSPNSPTEEEEDADYAPRNEVPDHLDDDKLDDIAFRLRASVLEDTPDTSGTEDSSQPRLGKAKLKRAKKAAQATLQADLVSQQSAADFRCAVCQASFPSKTRLFTHIKEQGHAAPVAQVKTKGGRGKKK
jgi:DnaJ family protein A protein 5